LLLKNMLLGLLLFLVVFIITTLILLGIHPSTRPFKDENGNELPGSIALLQELEINGLKQWILIRGADSTNPVLLWLHGGPGSAQMPMSHYLDEELEEFFVVVHWDQRGAGKSNHSGFSEETMTVQQFKDDTVKVISFLKDRLDQEKIYLLGHSWGTQLGIELVAEYPELFHSYIAVSQLIDHARGVEIASDWLRNEMEKTGDLDGLATLDGLENPAHYHSDYREFARLAIAYGGNLDKSFIELALIAFKAPEYTFTDYFRYLNGMNRGGAPLHRDGVMAQHNYLDSIKEIKVPIYFFIGHHDYNTPYELVEEYYQLIEAPFKELVVFENSAHTPFISETDKFNYELIKLIRER